MCIWLVAGTAAIVIPWSSGQETRPVRSRTAPGDGRRISIDLSSPAGTGSADRPGAPALAGSKVTVTLIGEPKARCLWQFGYNDAVVGQKRLQLDTEGVGRFRFILPDVRSRAECKLVIISNGKKVFRRLVVLPSARLAENAELIRACRLAVIDDSGMVQNTLKDEKVVFENLITRLLQDSFDGGAVILAGFEKNALLQDACRRLDGRIKKGMFALIVNPPEKWACWGISRRRLSVPLKAPVKFTEDFGCAVQPADLGSGPWQSALYGKKPWKTSAWVDEVGKDKAGKPYRLKHPLITVRRIGRGGVIVVLLPQIADPLADAAGRGVFDESMLWILAQRPVKTLGKEKMSWSGR